MSFCETEGTSVNDRTIEDLLTPCIYGHMLRRLLHQIHRQRLAFPGRRILIVKYDLDAAYRRLHVRPDQAVLATLEEEDERLKVHAGRWI